MLTRFPNGTGERGRKVHEVNGWEEEDDDFEREPYCDRCSNTGWICDCIDDLCQGGEPGESCIHGDGDKLCPDCKGKNAF